MEERESFTFAREYHEAIKVQGREAKPPNMALMKEDYFLNLCRYFFDLGKVPPEPNYDELRNDIERAFGLTIVFANNLLVPLRFVHDSKEEE